MPDIEFPEKLQILFVPKRYKVLYGGRGAGRSWNVSRALLIKGTQRPNRNLCAREYQNSIAESVHKVLADQITELKMNYLWEVQRDKIFTRPGIFQDPKYANGQSSFAFEGIKNNVNRIKSYEGLDYCWIEEAVKVSKNSWKTLIPTVRKEVCPAGHKQPPVNFAKLALDSDDFGDDQINCAVCGEPLEQSEIWMTFNPELETDYTFKRFVVGANPKNSFVVKMTWQDNPWFPQVLLQEMLQDKKEDYDGYLNIWEGHCRIALEGAIYAKELRRATEEGRIVPRRLGGVPWDRQTPVDTFWDLGRADRTAIWFAQRVAMQYRILGYYEASQQDILHYLRYCQGKEWNYGTMWLPHDAKAKRLGSKRTIEEIVRGYAGWNVRIVPKLSVEDGINAARMVFPNCWFDERECEEGINRLRHYRYEVKENQDGEKFLGDKPLHDDASDGADAFRYLAVAIKQPGRGGRASVSERLAELAANVIRGREQEFASAGGRGRGAGPGTSWMGL